MICDKNLSSPDYPQFPRTKMQKMRNLNSLRHPRLSMEPFTKISRNMYSKLIVSSFYNSSTTDHNTKNKAKLHEEAIRLYQDLRASKDESFKHNSKIFRLVKNISEMTASVITHM